MQGKIVLLYHNITPPDLTMGGGNFFPAKLYAGLEDLKSFVDIPVLAVGSSSFNMQQLKNVGFRRTEKLPIILNFPVFDRSPDKKLMQQYDDDMVNFVTVSRIYPHKKIEDTIRIFYYYHNLINPHSRLFIIGDPRGMEWYYGQLENFYRKLNLNNVIFTGRVRFRELLAYYRLSKVFISMSEHEGFVCRCWSRCISACRSLHIIVPLSVRTLDDAGILVNEKRCGEIAELAHLLVTDEELRTRVINKQKDRALYFQPDALVSRLQKILSIATNSNSLA